MGTGSGRDVGAVRALGLGEMAQGAVRALGLERWHRVQSRHDGQRMRKTLCSVE